MMVFLCVAREGMSFHSTIKTHFLRTGVEKPNLDEEAYDCGYDLDEETGPLYDAVEDEEGAELYEEDDSPTGKTEEEYGGIGVSEMEI